MKNERQEMILKIIEDADIETQEQLMLALQNAGYQTTQATISRDIKQLRLVKRVTARGRTRYELPRVEAAPQFTERMETIFRQCMIQCSAAQNIIVIKTLPGLASAACSAIDSMVSADVVGTLAGDDTGIIIMKDSTTASAFCKEIRMHMKK